MDDWRTAPPCVPDRKPTAAWWTRFAGRAFDWSAWRKAREAEQARLRNLGTRYDPVNRTSDDFQGGRTLKRRDTR